MNTTTDHSQIFTNHITFLTDHILTAFIDHIPTAFTNHIPTAFSDHISTRSTCSLLPRFTRGFFPHRTNMQDLIDKTHSLHYELFRRSKLEQMGFSDGGGDSEPHSLQETYELRRQEYLKDIQIREEKMRQTFVQKVKDKEAELKASEQEVCKIKKKGAREKQGRKRRRKSDRKKEWQKERLNEWKTPISMELWSWYLNYSSDSTPTASYPVWEMWLASSTVCMLSFPVFSSMASLNNWRKCRQRRKRKWTRRDECWWVKMCTQQQKKSWDTKRGRVHTTCGVLWSIRCLSLRTYVRFLTSFPFSWFQEEEMNLFEKKKAAAQHAQAQAQQSAAQASKEHMKKKKWSNPMLSLFPMMFSQKIGR